MRHFIKDRLEGKHSDLICLLTYLAEPVSTKDLRSIAATLGWNTRELNAATDFLTYAEIIETRWISYSDRIQPQRRREKALRLQPVIQQNPH